MSHLQMNIKQISKQFKLHMSSLQICHH